MLKHTYSNNINLNVDLYPDLLGEELAAYWYNYIDSYMPKDKNRRNTMMLGDEGVIYNVKYSGVDYSDEVTPWSEIPALYSLKELVEKVTEQSYTVCAIMKYPTGNIGIAPHRDKEMVAGTRICGLSLGAVRTIVFAKNGYETVKIPLPSGSLYCMNPPTNQYWTHSISKEPLIKKPRISLTFRDYR